ncbi:heavy metal translocating P-type ATPase [Uliginosibacterium sp. H1]|uniref:heavy metal translocating P-type ATPase n=1 Tax=Uliginosibacterium sp. H1 TaxID=3114757 RepID=UPI002E17B438|nr:heavy metal translocating P-type ATPase [Uliginosibacterium sp. H1]
MSASDKHHDHLHDDPHGHSHDPSHAGAGCCTPAAKASPQGTLLSLSEPSSTDAGCASGCCDDPPAVTLYGIAEPDSGAACATDCCGDHDGAVAAAPAKLAPAAPVAGGIRTPIRIMQMDCPTEEGLLRKKLGGMPQVTQLDFNLMQRVLTVTHAPAALPAVLDAVRSLGFTPEVADGDATPQAPVAEPAKPWWPLALAGAAAVGSEVAHWLSAPEWLSAALAILAVLACGITTYRKGWIAVRNGNLNINALMSIAVTGALLIGQWPEAAMVMVLFTIAEMIEAKSLDRARNAIRGLMDLAPEKATVQQPDGSWQERPAKDVAPGAHVRVRPGERIALDGTVVSGSSTVNQAPITGESLPVDKATGDVVFAGTINEAGSFEYCVKAGATDSTLARIIHAIEAAQGARAPTQRFVDRFARVYTPIVFLFALGVAVLPPLLFGGAWFEWIYKALVLLVIACPCALVISTPVTIVSGLAAAARQGILIKGGVHLEEGRRLDWIALDKTGTLTHGKPAQTDFAALADVPEHEVRSLAASLAARSDHPVSRAVAQAAQRDDIPAQDVDGFEALPGRGTQGLIHGARYRLGNHRLVHELGLCSDALESRLAALETQGKTVILIADEARVLGLFAVADTLKDSSRAAVAELHALGVRTVMLTGDNSATARAIATQAGIDEAQGELLPEDKLGFIESRLAEGLAVGMVGDGINDAPALARADIGFAMGAAGTGTAIETADVALMDDDLRKLPRFVRLSRRTHAVLLQNIVFALGIKAVFFAITLAGIGTMWMAVFADVGASLLVVANGLRLLRSPKD